MFAKATANYPVLTSKISKAAGITYDKTDKTYGYKKATVQLPAVKYTKVEKQSDGSYAVEFTVNKVSHKATLVNGGKDTGKPVYQYMVASFE